MIVIIYASEQDNSVVQKITSVLDELKVTYHKHIASAHKVPELVLKILARYEKEAELCYITIAGRSNGLSGVVAANTVHPVIACPHFSDKADYLVNVHSSLQMPSETPVMTVIQPENAALACAKIISLRDKGLKNRLAQRIKKVKQGF